MVAILRLLRPKQWTKNLTLLFPPLFGGVLFTPPVFHKLPIPLLAFCLASSATYVVNDLLDAGKDACHPVKKNRPIPSGAVGRKAAMLVAISLCCLAVSIGSLVSRAFLFTLLGYLLLSCVYSLRLKDIPVVDIFCVSAGFLLRLEAGGIAFGIQISEWLFMSVFLLAIFLSIGKRIAEKQTLKDDCACHRPVLEAYPLDFLYGSMYMTAAAVLVTYAMYVVELHPSLLYTIPLSFFGLMRYIYQIVKGSHGDPTTSLFQDKVLLVVSLSWATLIAWNLCLP